MTNYSKCPHETEEAFNQNLRKRLRQYRIDSNMTQQEVADRAGLNRVTVCNIENGSSGNPLAYTLGRLANALDVDVDYFYR